MYMIHTLIGGAARIGAFTSISRGPTRVRDARTGTTGQGYVHWTPFPSVVRPPATLTAELGLVVPSMHCIEHTVPNAEGILDLRSRNRPGASGGDATDAFDSIYERVEAVR